MKKIALSLAAVAVATVFAPEASAVPAFARQTGMACSACHYQSYPALTGFGKAFKTAGYTMMGAQGKIEGDHGLSIPETLNMGMYMQARYKKTGGEDTGTTRKTNSGRIDLPDEFSMFIGGRVSENIGTLTEMSMTVGNSKAKGLVSLAGFKMPITAAEFGENKLIVVPFTVSGLGPQYGFELLATGATNNGRVIENGVGYSAHMYIGAGTDASGATVGVAHENYYVTYTPWAQGHNVTNTESTNATVLQGSYIRAVYMPTIGGLDTAIGVSSYGGNSQAGLNGIDGAGKNDAMTIIDGQVQGVIAGFPMGIYASYATAPKSTSSMANTFNASTDGDRTAMGVLADIGLIENTLNLQLGMMQGKTGLKNADSGELETDNSYTIGMRYKLRQNVKLAFAYTSFSGSAYDVGGSGGALVANGTKGDWEAGAAGSKAKNGASLLNVIFSAAY